MLDLVGRPLVQWLAAKALAVAEEVLIAAHADRVGGVQAPCPGRQLVPGGATREDSVARIQDGGGPPPWAAAAGGPEQSTLRLVLRAGLPARAVPREEKTGLKLTTAEDLAMGPGLAGWLA